MKVLFGLNNDDMVKSIVRFYEENYDEKLEYKNIYYFKQVITELANGSYDRLVILEELEKFPTTNYAQIDDFLFSNIDSLTDEMDANNIIYIASDRRKPGDAFLTKLFNLGVYSVLTGQNRTKSKVSEVINVPKKKKDVKQYYEEGINKNPYGKPRVSELEIQRIISYYKNQNGDPSKYTEIFDKIGMQYTNEQLLIIIGFLPDEIRGFLAENSNKYKEVLQSATINAGKNVIVQEKVVEKEKKPAKSDIIDKMAEPVKPEVIEKVVVKQTVQKAPVITQVMEKETVYSEYSVPKDYKKVVCFIGAPSTGTTFCVNAIATNLFKKKIKVGVIDLTKKRDLFSLYTYDNEGKRAIAAESLKYASNGINEPLMYDKLSIYSGAPGDDRNNYNASTVIQTVSAANSVVLIDCDFSTPLNYYRLANEIFVVQDMNVLNVSQITLLLRELKNHGIPMSKVRVIINKHVKCALTSKDILDGIATYTSSDMRMFDTLFPSSQMTYYILPFDQENYIKYIEMVYKYKNTFDKFTDEFKEALYEITNSIYPIGKKPESGKKYKKEKVSKRKQNLWLKKTKAAEKGNKVDFEKEIME